MLTANSRFTEVFENPAIEEIPFNVLIDPKGTIIAQKLHGPALQQKLAEVLK